jgi:hypothetical protein
LEVEKLGDAKSLGLWFISLVDRILP